MTAQITEILKNCPPDQKKMIGEMVNKFTELVKAGKTNEAMNYLMHMRKTAQEKLQKQN